MNLITTIPLAWRTIIARPGRSLGAVAGLALGIAMYVALVALSQGYAGLVRQPLAQLKSDAIVQRPGAPRNAGAAPGISLPPGNAVLSPRDVARVKNLGGVGSVSPALLLWERSPSGFTVVMGFDPRGPRQGAATVLDWLIQGGPLRNDGDLLLEEHFVRVHAKKLGDVWPLGGQPFTIRGIVRIKAGGALAASNAFISLDAARSLAGLPRGASNLLFLRLKAGVGTTAAAKELARVLPGAVMTSADSIGKMMQGFSLISGKFASVLGALALAFTGMLYLRLVKGALWERNGEVGIMKALGWRRREVTWALVTESMLLGLGGAVLGVAVGWLSAWGVGELGVSNRLPWDLNPLPAGVVSHSAATGGAAVNLPVVFPWLAGIVSLAFVLALSALTGWWASRIMFKATVLTSLREP